MAGRVVTDQMGRQVKIPDEPQRIISLVPSITELLFDLGLGDRVVGVTRFCVHPETARKQAANIGGTKDLKPDRIADLKPDLIIGNKEENTRPQIELLETQFPVWMSDVLTVAHGVDMIAEIGAVCGKADEGNQMAQEVANRFAQFEGDLKTTEIRVAYLIWNNPMMVSSSGTFIHDIIHRVGWQNVFGNAAGRYPAVSESELSGARPQLILLSSEPFPFSEKHVDEFERKYGCPVMLVDGEMFSWYGSRMLKMPAYLKNLSEKIIHGQRGLDNTVDN